MLSPRIPIATFLLLLALAAPAQAAPVLGVNVRTFPDATHLAEAQAVGAKSVRGFLVWANAEPVRGQLSQHELDIYAAGVQKAKALGLDIHLVVVGPPAWASGSTNPNAAPRNPNDYASFLARFAADTRIAGNGVAYGFAIWRCFFFCSY